MKDVVVANQPPQAETVERRLRTLRLQSRDGEPDMAVSAIRINPLQNLSGSEIDVHDAACLKHKKLDRGAAFD